MITAETDYRNVLKRELEKRCQAMPRYSLRAFARDLQLSPSRLSEVLAGKQGLSGESALRVAGAIGLSAQESELFCTLVESRHARARTRREHAQKKLDQHKLASAFETLRPDVFSVIADWYHIAILKLLELNEFEYSAQWIAKRLNISVAEASSAMDRLERLELIRIEKGRPVLTKRNVATTNDIPSEAIRKAHKQVLSKAAQELELQPVEQREYAACTMAIDEALVPDAKRWIRNFYRRFMRRMERAENKTQVYCFSAQFFSLTPNAEKEIPRC